MDDRLLDALIADCAFGALRQDQLPDLAAAGRLALRQLSSVSSQGSAASADVGAAEDAGVSLRAVVEATFEKLAHRSVTREHIHADVRLALDLYRRFRPLEAAAGAPTSAREVEALLLRVTQAQYRYLFRMAKMLRGLDGRKLQAKFTEFDKDGNGKLQA